MKIAELLLAKTGNAHRHSSANRVCECASVCMSVCVCVSALGLCRECVNYLGKPPNAFQDEFLLRVYARQCNTYKSNIYIYLCIYSMCIYSIYISQLSLLCVERLCSR